MYCLHIRDHIEKWKYVSCYLSDIISHPSMDAARDVKVDLENLVHEDLVVRHQLMLQTPREWVIAGTKTFQVIWKSDIEKDKNRLYVKTLHSKFSNYSLHNVTIQRCDCWMYLLEDLQGFKLRELEQVKLDNLHRKVQFFSYSTNCPRPCSLQG